VVLIIIVWTVSMILTRPLSWMQRVAWSIVNHTDASVVRQSLRLDSTCEASCAFDSSPPKDHEHTHQTHSHNNNKPSLMKWTPKSEVTELVKEFKQMIRGFSGTGKASSVAKSTFHEVRNTLAWQSDFQPLYEKAIVPESAAGDGDVIPSTSCHRRLSNASSHQRRMSLRNVSGLKSESLEKSCVSRLSSLRNLSVGSGLHLMPGDKGSDGRLSSLHSLSVGSTGSKHRNNKNRPNNPTEEKGPSFVSDVTETEMDADVEENKDDGEAETGEDLAAKDAASSDDSPPNNGPDCVFRSYSRGDSDGVAGAFAEKNKEAQPHPDSVDPMSTSTTVPETFAMPQLVGPNHDWRNEGRNMTPPYLFAKKDDHDSGSCVPLGSSLFRWILVLIVIPMIITNAVIVATISERIGDLLPAWLDRVGEDSFHLQEDSLSVASKFAALYAEAVLASPVRDLFLFTRVAEWIFTDAVKRETTGYVELKSGSEECKAYTEDISMCPWYDNIFENAPCDCSWETPAPKQCFLMGKNRDTRHMQKLWYAGQRHDADPITGRRVNTSFPELDYSPETTSWWDNVSDVPGSAKGMNASGYETTYDRLRVFSALSTILFPLYNYRAALVSKGENRFLGVYIGWEADGMLAGWSGCQHPSPNYAHFVSTEENHAATLNSTLCPLGKYGYDSRCRGWYDSGKKTALGKAENETSLYLTPPYEFASSLIKACSATQAIIDPRTGEVIGQALIDFLQTKFEMIHMGQLRSDNSFHFVISPSGDSVSGDTVVGPDPTSRGEDLEVNFRVGSIGDFVLPHDHVNSSNRKGFDHVVSDMKLGSTCFQNFTRTKMKTMADGKVITYESTYRVAYDPIHVRALDSVQCDDYSRGVKVSQALVYSLAVARSEESMKQPFKEFEKETKQKLKSNVSIYIGLTVFVSLMATAVACRVRLFFRLYHVYYPCEKLNYFLSFIGPDLRCGDQAHDCPSPRRAEHKFRQDRR